MTDQPPAEVPGAFGRRVGSSVRWSLVDQVVQQLIRLGIVVLLTRFTSPDAYGLIGMAFLFTGLATFIGDLGLGTAVVQRAQLRREHLDTAWTASLLAGTVLFALTVLLARPAADFFDQPGLAAVLMVVALNFPLRGPMGVVRDRLRRDLTFRSIALVNVISVTVSGVVAVIMAVSGYGVWALVSYSVLESALIAAGMSLALVREGHHHPRPRIHRGAFADIGSFGAAVMGAKLLTYIQMNADNLLVGKFLGSAALGYYGLAYRLMLYPIQRVGDVTSNVTLPVFSRLVDAPGRLTRAFGSSTAAICFVSFPFAAATVTSAPILVPAVLGEQWAPATLCLQVLTLNAPRLALVRLTGSLFQAIGRPHWEFAISMIAVPLYVVGFVIGLRYGIVGVAIGYTLVGHLVALPHLVLLWRTPLVRPGRILIGLWPLVVQSVALAATVLLVARLTAGEALGLRAVLVVGAGALVWGLVALTTSRQLLGEARSLLVARG